MSTDGCSHCGYTGGDCMAPGDSCPFAVKMRAPKPVYSHDVAPLEPDLSAHWTPPVAPAHADGVWATYEGVDDGEREVAQVSVHRDELSALRRAVEHGLRVSFLKYDDVL